MVCLPSRHIILHIEIVAPDFWNIIFAICALNVIVTYHMTTDLDVCERACCRVPLDIK